VVREGSLYAGAPILIVERDENTVSMADLIALYAGDIRDPELLQRARRVGALPQSWREELQHRATRTNAAPA
jgi:MOSC domain-containing protein YiiM